VFCKYTTISNELGCRMEYSINIVYSNVFLKQIFVKSSLFYIDADDAVYTSHQLVTSSVNFRQNLRYFGFVKSDDTPIVYIPGRELLVKDNIKLKKLEKTSIPIKDVTMKTIFGGLNSYKYSDARCIIHTLLFSAFVLKHHKTLYKCLYSFLKLNVSSLKFVYLNFKHKAFIFKKMKSIKKNKLKNTLKVCKRSDYKLITF